MRGRPRHGSRSTGPSAERVPRAHRRRADRSASSAPGPTPTSGVVCLTGAGERAFCTGGDQKQRAETGDYGPSESGLFEVEYAAPRDPRRAEAGHRGRERLRDRRRPRAARAVRPDDRGRHARSRPDRAARRLLRRRLRHRPTWPASSARSGRARSGSCAASTTRSRRCDWGLVNKVVPAAELRAEVRALGRRDLALSPTALRSSSSRSTPTPSTSPASASSRSPRSALFVEIRRGPGGHHRVQREARARLRALPGGRVGLTREPADDRARDRQRDPAQRQPRDRAAAAHQLCAAAVALQHGVEVDRDLGLRGPAAEGLDQRSAGPGATSPARSSPAGLRRCSRGR